MFVSIKEEQFWDLLQSHDTNQCFYVEIHEKDKTGERVKRNAVYYACEKAYKNITLYLQEELENFPVCSDVSIIWCEEKQILALKNAGFALILFLDKNIISKLEVDQALHQKHHTERKEKTIPIITESKRLSIIEKIKKSLSLARNNPSVEEAETALLMAQKMMVKYQIDEHDIKDQDTFIQRPTMPNHAVELCSAQTEAYEDWKGKLLNVIAENFRCFCFTRSYYLRKVYFCFGGLEQDVEIAMLTYEFAKNIAFESAEYFIKEEKEQEKQKKVQAYLQFVEDQAKYGLRDWQFEKYYREPNYRERKLSYYYGFVSGLKNKLKEQVQQNQWGLVLVKDQSVLDLQNQLVIKPRRSSHNGRSLHSNAYHSGYERGNSLTVHSEIH